MRSLPIWWKALYCIYTISPFSSNTWTLHSADVNSLVRPCFLGGMVANISSCAWLYCLELVVAMASWVTSHSLCNLVYSWSSPPQPVSFLSYWTVCLSPHSLSTSNLPFTRNSEETSVVLCDIAGRSLEEYHSISRNRRASLRCSFF